MQSPDPSSQMHLWQRIQSWGRLLFSRDTPWKAKAILAFAIVYLISPFDLIPDWLGVLGLVDDLTLVSLLVAWAVRIAEKNKNKN